MTFPLNIEIEMPIAYKIKYTTSNYSIEPIKKEIDIPVEYKVNYICNNKKD